MGALASASESSPHTDSSNDTLSQGPTLSYATQDPAQYFPICSLPPEILLCVFEFVPYLRDPLGFDSTQIAWAESIAISQTCSYLRQAAHACSNLWTVVPMHSAAWAELALRLSRDHPLSLQAFQFQAIPGSWQTAFNPVTSRLALRHLPRIQNLVLGHPHRPHLDSESTAFLNELCAPLPMLNTLFVYRVPMNRHTLGHAPRLRRLVLTGTHIAADACILSPSITELAFVGAGATQTSWGGDRPAGVTPFEDPLPGPAILQVLQPLTNLRRLVLVDTRAGTPGIREANAAAARIRLPRLEYIRIEGIAWWWPLLVALLDVPRTARIDVRGCAFPNDRAPFASALPEDTIQLVWGEDASFARAHVVPAHTPPAEILPDAAKCAVVLSGLAGEKGRAPPGLTVSLDVAVHPRIIELFPLLDGLEIPCLYKLEALEVHHPELGVCYTEPTHAVSKWVRTARAHPNMRHISAVGAAAESLLEAIGAFPEDFAGVRTLVLRKADMGGLGHALLRRGPSLRAVVSECVPIDEARGESFLLYKMVGNRVEWRIGTSGVVDKPVSNYCQSAPRKGDELFECPKELLFPLHS